MGIEEPEIGKSVGTLSSDKLVILNGGEARREGRYPDDTIDTGSGSHLPLTLRCPSTSSAVSAVVRSFTGLAPGSG